MIMTYKEATELNGFVFDHNGDIVEANYAEFVSESQSECTHHTGIIPKYSVEEITGDIYKDAAGEEIAEDQYNDLSKEDQDECTYLGEGVVCYATVSRNSHQRGYSIDQKFDNEEDANNYWFSQIEKYDFAKDDQRDTSFYNTWEEAVQVLAEREQY